MIRARLRTPILIAIVGLGLAARMAGIAFGLPNVLAHPDEARIANAAVGFLGGTLHPGFFNYPSLYLYAVGSLDAVFCAAAVAGARFDSIGACAGSWPSRPEPFIMTARLTSVVAGTLTILLTYRLTRRFAAEGASLAAAAFLAVAFLHVRDSHFGVTDVSMTALLVLAVLLLVRAHDSRRLLDATVAGFVAGLAISTKYGAAIVAVPFAASLLVRSRDSAVSELAAHALAAATAAAAGFLLGTPFAVIDFHRFWTDVSYESSHLAAGHAIDLGVGWRYHLTTTLPQGVSVPLLVAACAGAAWMLRQKTPRSWLLLAFPLAYYAVAGRGHTVFARYMVPIVPFVCVLAGIALGQVSGWLARRSGRSAGFILAAGAIALAAPGAWKDWHFGRLLARTDSRVLAAEWLTLHVPAGATIYQTGSHYGRPDLSRAPAAPGILRYDETAMTFRTMSGEAVARPDWLVVQEHPLIVYSRVPEVIRAMLPAYDLRHVVRAIDTESWHVFDQQDALFVPLAGFDGAERPGPNLYVYSRRE